MKKLTITALMMATLFLLLWLLVVNGLFTDVNLSFIQKNTVKNLGNALLSFGCLTAFWGLLGLVFNKKLTKWCSLQTILIALGLAVVVSLGLYSGLSLFSCYLDSSPSRHPIRYPASGALGCLSLAGFVGLFCLYCKVRTKKPSVPGVILEVVMSLSYWVPFLYLWVIADNILSNLI